MILLWFQSGGAWAGTRSTQAFRIDSPHGAFQRALRILTAVADGGIFSGRIELMPVPDDLAYLALCELAGLTPELSQRSLTLAARGLSDPALLEQPEPDFIRAYAAARAALPVFVGQLGAFGLATGTVPVSRPGGVKSLDRMVEKYSLTEELPLDLLAGKVVAGSLRELYRLADLILAHFTIRGYRDRMVQPRASGYRDLQFVIEVEGQLAEFKVIHAVFDELDTYEHRLYEMRRSLEARTQAVPGLNAPTLSAIEVLVLDNLIDVSAHLFQQAWDLVLRQEVDG